MKNANVSRLTWPSVATDLLNDLAAERVLNQVHPGQRGRARVVAGLVGVGLPGVSGRVERRPVRPATVRLPTAGAARRAPVGRFPRRPAGAGSFIGHAGRRGRTRRAAVRLGIARADPGLGLLRPFAPGSPGPVSAAAPAVTAAPGPAAAATGS
jgi:hypothetical protein